MSLKHKFAIIFCTILRFEFTFCAENTCGISIVGQGNIIGGVQVPKDFFPWIAALIGSNGKYFCGGALISNRKILTAAHCIHRKYSRVEVLPRQIRVLLGVYDLNDQFETGRLTSAVKSIRIHPDWNPNVQSFDADIALLNLEDQIPFSNHVQPICLDFSSKIISLTEGFVVGYGKSEDVTKIHENIPKIIKTPIHQNADCFLKNSHLTGISSNRTFCGGNGDGAGVCIGDSGSGLFVLDGEKYFLRGIVSSSLFNFGQSCNVNTYSVFTDLRFYNQWIMNGDIFNGKDENNLVNKNSGDDSKTVVEVKKPKDQLQPNECLKYGESLESANGCFYFIMQFDGNVVLYRKHNNQPLWDSRTQTSCTNRICMQSDGNLVAYDCHNIATWSTGTVNNEGASLTAQDDGNLVMYAWGSNRAVWNSGTLTGC